jgi:hypothetical protein
MSGWIKLHRKSLSHWLYKENRPHTKREAWEDLLLYCNHSDEKVLIGNELIECKRGQSIKSLLTWSKKFNWTVSKVRRFFILLENDSMIRIENVKKTTRITICKYEDYQGERNEDETKMKRKRNASETKMKTNKKVKKVKNEEENIYKKFDHLKITKIENQKLLDLGYSQTQIDTTYSKIENYRKNTNYKSLYLTSIDWLKREYPDIKKETSSQKLDTSKLK